MLQRDGAPSQVIDGHGNLVTYIYDAVGNLLSITRKSGGVVIYRNAGVILALNGTSA
jgi:YD repeat-containing protein